nr:HAMP domain-containing sensor histidine kinase [uncultured Blautia sp.]
MEAVFLGIAVLCTGFALWERHRSRVMYREIDRMMDEILSAEPVTISDLKEGPLSALSYKARRLQERQNLEVSGVSREKEQVKMLVSNMSHQLKTPLANVRMYGEILENQELSEEQRRHFFGKLRRQTEKIQWVLTSLLKMVRLEQDVITFEGKDADIKPTLLQAVNSIYEKADKKQIQIQVEKFPSLYLWHNPSWTAEALENLLENAVKYSPSGSTITIRVKPYEMYSELQITDQGAGIDKAEETEIFKRFYRSPKVSEEEGSGIGLYLVKLILEKEKGYVTVDSQPGHGSTFSVFLQNCK